MSMTVPAVIGREGIHDIKVLELADEEQTALENTVSVLSPMMRYVEAYLDIK
jgi:malate/lactate dehydrogenase